ncbi:uncharacterized protein [Diadema antillarum]|uniref:uncharacterized protein n=1 Tax=Diadema antillarum TaxID=105358 RepID=UPI003A83D6A6
MADDVKTEQTDKQRSSTQMDWKPRVLVCTSSLQSSVQGFIDYITREFGHLASDIQFCQLPYNDVSDFSFRDRPVDAVILCHSIHNRRMAITDVTDALYDKFLPKTARFLGKNNIGVIVHDMPSEKMDTSDKYKQQIGFLKTTQPTTFACASLVAMAGNLGPNSPELFGDSLVQTEQFLRRTSPRRATDHKSDERVVLSLCSRGEESEVKGLKSKISIDMAEIVSEVKYSQLDALSIKKIGKKSFEDIEVVLLCHSLEDQRVVVTDVEGALYDKFLRKAKYKLGKKRVGFILYNVDEWGERQGLLDENTYPTLHRKSSLQLICGGLSTREDGEIDMDGRQMRDLRDFLHEASETPIRCFCRRCRSNCCC